MKHLFNNISEEERQSILEQHTGGMKVITENFNKMVNKTLGQVDLYEQGQEPRPLEVLPGYKLDILTNDEIFKKWTNINPNNLSSFAQTVLNMESLTPNGEEEARKVYFDVMSKLGQIAADYGDISRSSAQAAINQTVTNRGVEDQIPNDFRDDMSKLIQNKERFVGMSDWVAKNAQQVYRGLKGQTT